MKVEICANSFESARAAQQGGADRIELCTELSVGGLTPSHGLIEKVLDELEIPVHVLIRPRSGDFTYSESELDMMCRDIQYCEAVGCDGIVTGALNAYNEPHSMQLKQLKACAGEMHFTFHRAFDWCAEPFEAVEELIILGFNRLLTSGQKPTAKGGLPLLKKLFEKYSEKIEIMPGSGITLDNISFFKSVGFSSIHLSATAKHQKLLLKPKVSMHSKSFFEEGIVATSQYSLISEIVSASKGL